MPDTTRVSTAWVLYETTETIHYIRASTEALLYEVVDNGPDYINASTLVLMYEVAPPLPPLSASGGEGPPAQLM